MMPVAYSRRVAGLSSVAEFRFCTPNAPPLTYTFKLIRQSGIGVKPLWLLSSLVGYPVRFPRFPSIGRKRLLEVWRIRCDA
jgi:hypothetical protein